jgi:hypothetical protein
MQSLPLNAALAGLDVMAALVASPIAADDAGIAGILDGVRTAEEPGSKAALIRAAVSQAGATAPPAFKALAGLLEPALASSLAEAGRASFLDRVAALMREIVGPSPDAGRRATVIGAAALLRIAADGDAALRTRVRALLLDAARGFTGRPAPEVPVAA